MKAHLTGYFWMYRCVYLLHSACKRIFAPITQLNFATILQICCTFFAYNVFKIAFDLFCFVRLLLASTTSELRLHIKCVRDCYVRVLFTNTRTC